MATQEIKVPPLGESVTEATVARWLKKVGESVAIDEPVVELETDKVTLEVPAPSGGVITEQAAAVGDNVAMGAVIGRLDEAGEASAPAPKLQLSLRLKPNQLRKPNLLRHHLNQRQLQLLKQPYRQL